MRAVRGVAFGALLLAAVVVGYVLLTGGAKSEYSLVFQNAGQLVNDDDVQVGGRRVGSIKDIELTNDNQARVKIEVEDAFKLKEGTTASIRITSLSGIANRYIVLTPGNGDELAEKTVIPTDKTTTQVDLDQLFNALDAPTRKGLQQFVQGQATQFKGKGEKANEAARFFNPFLSTSRRLVNEVVRDQRSLNAFIEKGAAVTQRLAARDSTLTDLVDNANTTASAIGDESANLERTLGALPDTLRRANSTFVNLRATLTDLDVLVDESKPATRRLAPFLRELRPLVRDARPTIRDLRTLIRRPGDGNDLIDLLNRTPRLRAVAKPSFTNTTKALDRSQDVLEFIRPYTPDLVGWFRDFGQGASNYDANGHFARIQPIFSNFSFSDNPAGGTLTPTSPAQRQDGLSLGNVRRCPGSATTQLTEDGSGNFRDSDGELDCDPSLARPRP